MMLSIVTVLSILPVLVLRGYILSTMWLWFVPLPPISIPAAIGMFFIVGMFRDGDVKEWTWVKFWIMWLFPVLTLGLGYILTLFM